MGVELCTEHNLFNVADGKPILLGNYLSWKNFCRMVSNSKGKQILSYRHSGITRGRQNSLERHTRYEWSGISRVQSGSFSRLWMCVNSVLAPHHYLCLSRVVGLAKNPPKTERPGISSRIGQGEGQQMKRLTSRSPLLTFLLLVIGNLVLRYQFGMSLWGKWTYGITIPSPIKRIAWGKGGTGNGSHRPRNPKNHRRPPRRQTSPRPRAEPSLTNISSSNPTRKNAPSSFGLPALPSSCGPSSMTNTAKAMTSTR